MGQKIWNVLTKSGFWLVIFTGLLTVFTYMLTRISDESNQTNRITQRAFVIFNGLSAGVALTSSTDPQTKVAKKVSQEVLVNWLNTGATPARDAVTESSFQAWRSDLPQGFDFHDITRLTNPKENRIVIGPHQGIPSPMFVTIDNFEAQRNGTDRRFFWGWVVYKDAFPHDPPRLTEFCTEMIQVAIDPKKDFHDPTNTMAWNTQPCHAHSCYDEDCSDYADRVKQAEATAP